jgi:hypothetical protein
MLSMQAPAGVRRRDQREAEETAINLMLTVASQRREAAVFTE